MELGARMLQHVMFSKQPMHLSHHIDHRRHHSQVQLGMHHIFGRLCACEQEPSAGPMQDWAVCFDDRETTDEARPAGAHAITLAISRLSQSADKNEPMHELKLTPCVGRWGPSVTPV